MKKDIAYYHSNSVTEAQRFDSVDFESVHASWKTYWPTNGQTLLDVGAGSGRDALYFSTKGVNVVAVEPAVNLLKIASAKTNKVTWKNDCLPNLPSISNVFDVVLVSAVWMFLTKDQRIESFKRLSELVKDEGKVIISYKTAEITYVEMIADSKNSGLYCISCTGTKSSIDPSVMFETMVFNKHTNQKSIIDTLFY